MNESKFQFSCEIMSTQYITQNHHGFTPTVNEYTFTNIEGIVRQTKIDQEPKKNLSRKKRHNKYMNIMKQSNFRRITATKLRLSDSMVYMED